MMNHGKGNAIKNEYLFAPFVREKNMMYFQTPVIERLEDMSGNADM